MFVTFNVIIIECHRCPRRPQSGEFHRVSKGDTTLDLPQIGEAPPDTHRRMAAFRSPFRFQNRWQASSWSPATPNPNMETVFKL